MIIQIGTFILKDISDPLSMQILSDTLIDPIRRGYFVMIKDNFRQFSIKSNVVDTHYNRHVKAILTYGFI